MIAHVRRWSGLRAPGSSTRRLAPRLSPRRAGGGPRAAATAGHGQGGGTGAAGPCPLPPAEPPPAPGLPAAGWQRPEPPARPPGGGSPLVAPVSGRAGGWPRASRRHGRGRRGRPRLRAAAGCSRPGAAPKRPAGRCAAPPQHPSGDPKGPRGLRPLQEEPEEGAEPPGCRPLSCRPWPVPHGARPGSPSRRYRGAPCPPPGQGSTAPSFQLPPAVEPHGAAPRRLLPSQQEGRSFPVLKTLRKR